MAALRSPAYACSDVDLARYQAAPRGSFNYLRARPRRLRRAGRRGLREPARLPQQRGDTLAGRAGRALRGRPPARRDRHPRRRQPQRFPPRALPGRAGARLRGRRAESLRAFVDWLERQRDEAILDQEGAGLDDDEDAVRVLTIHAAKGLEFPIVFLAGLGAPPRNSAPIFGHDRGDGRIAVRSVAPARPYSTLGPVDDVNDHEQAHATAERDRLLYVGATRARDHLVVSLFHKEKTRDSAAAQRLIDGGAVTRAEPPGSRRRRVRARRRALRRPGGRRPRTTRRFDERRTQLVAAARTLRYTSATALGREAAPGGGRRRSARTRPSPGRAAAPAPTSAGPCTPRCRACPGTPTTRRSRPWRAPRRSPRRSRPRGRGRARWSGVALDSDAAQRARAARRALREVPFAFPQDGG